MTRIEDSQAVATDYSSVHDTKEKQNEKMKRELVLSSPSC